MGTTYRFRAATVACEWGEGDHRGWGKWVGYMEIVFRPPGPERKQRRALYLQRCENDSGKRYLGPINVRFGEYDGPSADGGIREAVLTRNSFRLMLEGEAAAELKKTEIHVEFEITDEQFAELRSELAKMFARSGVYRDEAE
jgi:hypothetical protein